MSDKQREAPAVFDELTDDELDVFGRQIAAEEGVDEDGNPVVREFMDDMTVESFYQLTIECGQYPLSDALGAFAMYNLLEGDCGFYGDEVQVDLDANVIRVKKWARDNICKDWNGPVQVHNIDAVLEPDVEGGGPTQLGVLRAQKLRVDTEKIDQLMSVESREDLEAAVSDGVLMLFSGEKRGYVRVDVPRGASHLVHRVEGFSDRVKQLHKRGFVPDQDQDKQVYTGTADQEEYLVMNLVCKFELFWDPERRHIYEVCNRTSEDQLRFRCPPPFVQQFDHRQDEELVPVEGMDEADDWSDDVEEALEALDGTGGDKGDGEEGSDGKEHRPPQLSVKAPANPASATPEAANEFSREAQPGTSIGRKPVLVGVPSPVDGKSS